METQPALIRADRIVVLHPKPALDANIAIVIFPADPKADHPVGLAHPAQNLLAVIFGIFGDHRRDVLGYFTHRLNEFALVGIAVFKIFEKRIEVEALRHHLLRILSGAPQRPEASTGARQTP